MNRKIIITIISLILLVTVGILVYNYYPTKKKTIYKAVQTIITDEIKQDSEYMVKVSFPSIHKVYIENEFEDYYQVVGSCFVKEQTGLIKEKMYDITIRQKDKKEFEVLGFDIKN